MLQGIFNKIDSLLTRKRIVAYSRILLLLLLTFIAFMLYGNYFGYIGLDFFEKGDYRAFYTAGVMVANPDDEMVKELYNFEKQKNVQIKLGIANEEERKPVFLNPPLFAWVMIPLSGLPFTLSLNIWRLISLKFVVISIIIITKQLKLDFKWMDTLTIILVSMPGLWVFLSGQSTFLFLGVYSCSFLLLSKGYNFPAGLVLSLGTLKPQLFLFLPFILLFQKKWRVLFGFIIGSFMVTLISFYLVGTEGINEYLALLTSEAYEERIQSRAYIMHSLPSFLRLLSGLDLKSSYLTILILLLLASLTGYLNLKGSLKLEASELLALSIFGSLIAAPHLFHYDLALLVLPILLMYSWTQNTINNYVMARNFRLVVLALYVYLWISIFMDDSIRVQLSVLFILYLFISAIKQIWYKKMDKN